MREEVAHLEHIVDDLQVLVLDVSGALNLEITRVSVREVLAQVVKAHRASARAAGVSLSYESEDLTVDADPVRLRQIVDNLVSNGVRYTPRGGSVNVAARAESSSILIDVKDTRIGIEAADLRHVFDRFWRAEKSRTRQAGGRGLGLAITQRLAAALGGSITATSAPGQGSTFTVRLPARNTRTHA